jgi:hypothetical protein
MVRYRQLGAVIATVFYNAQVGLKSFGQGIKPWKNIAAGLTQDPATSFKLLTENRKNSKALSPIILKIKKRSYDGRSAADGGRDFHGIWEI